jgi:hypothetical protein
VIGHLTLRGPNSTITEAGPNLEGLYFLMFDIFVVRLRVVRIIVSIGHFDSAHLLLLVFQQLDLLLF